MIRLIFSFFFFSHLHFISHFSIPYDLRHIVFFFVPTKYRNMNVKHHNYISWMIQSIAKMLISWKPIKRRKSKNKVERKRARGIDEFKQKILIMFQCWWDEKVIIPTSMTNQSFDVQSQPILTRIRKKPKRNSYS